MLRRRILVTSVVLIMLFIPLSSAIIPEKVFVVVKNHNGDVSRKYISIEDKIKLENLMQKLIETGEFDFFLPIILAELEKYNLIRNADEMAKEIMSIADINFTEMQYLPFIFNVFCLIAGYGSNSWIETPASILSIFLYSIMDKLISNSFIHSIMETILFYIYFYSLFIPKTYLPLAGWIIAKEGKVNTLGLFGYQSMGTEKGNLFPPAFFVLYKFVGLAITFLWREHEETYVVGAAVAVFGG
jgi:hypothetical protein